MVTFMANMVLAVGFQIFRVLDGPPLPTTDYWQPAVVALFCNAGMAFTFLAVSVGDVSIATPMFGLKAVLVTAGVATITGGDVAATVWVAAILATAGVLTVQWTGRGDSKRTLRTIGLAGAAASCYAGFDVTLQTYAMRHGAAAVVPAVYMFVGLFSIPMLFWFRRDGFGTRGEFVRLVIPSAILFTVQAMCIAGTLSIVGDAPSVNVVYALRGLWGVVLAVTLAKYVGGEEANLTKRQIGQRFVGAAMLTVAVVVIAVREITR